MTSDSTRSFISVRVVYDQMNFSPNCSLFTFLVTWLTWDPQDRVLFSTTPRLITSSTNCNCSPALLIVMLEHFRLLNSPMVCDDSKTIALVFIALRVREISSDQVTTVLSASDNKQTPWAIAFAGTWT